MSGTFEQKMSISSKEKRQLLAQLLKRKALSEFKYSPLSFAQQQLWFLNQLEPENPFYNIPFALHLKGPLQVEVLERSLREIVRRHEALRTTFGTIDGLPQQVIAPSGPLSFALQDLRAIANEEQKAYVQQQILLEENRPFDLRVGPLLRTTLLQLAEEEHILLLVTHHIVADGWSLDVLMGELTQLYKAHLYGQLSPLAELPIQYADFALWQREWLQGEVLAEHLAYWKQRLADAPAVLQLPTDHPRPAIQTFRGATQQLALSAELTAMLRELNRREGVTMFMTLLAAFQTLLYRYTGQEDLVVGTPIANRTRKEVAELIGFFVNTLVLRTDLSGNPTFRTLLGRVREVALGAYAHQDLPFEKLVEELHPERNLSYNPLFQVMLALETPAKRWEWPGIDHAMWEVEQGAVHFDLVLRLEESVANPEQGIAQLLLLSEAEQQILVEWNDTRREYPVERCLHQLFEEQVQHTPDAVAVVCGSEQLSYQQLNSRANQLAYWLRQEGVNSTDLVGLCMPRSVDMLVGLLGILKAGAGYVPMDTEHPPARLATQLRQVQAILVLTHSQIEKKFDKWTGRCICLDRLRDVLNNKSTVDLSNQPEMQDVAYIIFTSGSTGAPKGVMVSHGNVYNYVQSLQRLLAPEIGWHYATASTIAADLGNTMIFGSLDWGGCLHILDYETVTSAQDFAEYVQQRPLDVLKMVPSHLSALLAGTQDPILPRHWLILGGEALPPKLLEYIADQDAKCQIVNHYGPTETTIGAIVNVLGEMQPTKRKGAEHSNNIAIGRPIDNMQTYILDAYQQLVPIGVIGELYLGGAGLAYGYIGQMAQTAQRFVPNPWGQHAGERLYRTGDLARYLPDGFIEYLGRVDRQIKIRGYRIELGEIEAILGRHPSVGSNAVLVQDNDAGDTRLVAYVELGPDLSEKELREYLREHLPEYMVPSAFVPLKQMPLTPNGKIDRRALALMDWKSALREEVVAVPQTPIEQMLVQIWEQVLGLSTIGVHDNFFALGGHSLLATQVISRIRETFQVEIPLRRLFDASTVVDLALVIAQSLNTQKGDLSGATYQTIQRNTKQILANLDQLSDGEIGALLDAAILAANEGNE